MIPQRITIPVNSVTLHRYLPGLGPDTFGEQIGDPIYVTKPGTIIFPPYIGKRDNVHVVARLDGIAQWSSGPLFISEGNTVSIQVPITGALS